MRRMLVKNQRRRTLRCALFIHPPRTTKNAKRRDREWNEIDVSGDARGAGNVSFLGPVSILVFQLSLAAAQEAPFLSVEPTTPGRVEGNFDAVEESDAMSPTGGSTDVTALGPMGPYRSYMVL